jgi:hypothetical protein
MCIYICVYVYNVCICVPENRVGSNCESQRLRQPGRPCEWQLESLKVNLCVLAFSTILLIDCLSIFIYIYIMLYIIVFMTVWCECNVNVLWLVVVV